MRSLLIAGALSLVLVGCGPKSEGVAETQISQSNAQQAAGNWSDEQKAAFAKAHEDARAGRDEEKAPGSPGGK